ncbi:MAG TPA: hypothetical protein VFF78_01490 [Anaerolineaceae bacterium]|nr:hypothetical protein [Anaerolineaceae bacterium]
MGCLLAPFKILWDLLAGILNLTGRLVGVILGFVLLIVGVVLTVLVITAPIGIPLIVFGSLILVRALF